jgi:hypothetical protein
VDVTLSDGTRIRASSISNGTTMTRRVRLGSTWTSGGTQPGPLAGVNPPEAVAWVRSNYRSDAVENVEQEACVDWFADYVRRADASDPSLGPITPRR